MRAFIQVPPQIRIGGTLSRSQYQLALQSTDPEELYHFGPILADEMKKIPASATSRQTSRSRTRRST